MNKPLNLVKSHIRDGNLDQQLVGILKRWPLLHFTEHAEAILKEGFLFGEANAGNLDLTYEIGGQPKSHPGPGYNFAFNAISWDVENDMHEFQAATPESGRSLQGMYGSSAILFLGSGLHTRHYDEFHQVILWGADVDFSRALHLQQIGEQFEDGEVVCDDSGNPVDCWIAMSGAGEQLSSPQDHLTLTECLVNALHHYHDMGLLSRLASLALAEVYGPELDELGLSVNTPEYSEDSSPEP